jgi:hypothetical protein
MDTASATPPEGAVTKAVSWEDDRHMRYGIVGCGMMGQEHIRNIALLAQAEVVGLAEPDAGMAAARRRWCPVPRPAPIPGLLRAQRRVDALVIASPNHCTSAAASTLPAPAPCRCWWKSRSTPPARTTGAARVLAARYPAPIWVAMEYRYMPPIARFRELATRRPAASRCSRSASTASPSSRKSATGTASTATPAARWSRNAAISST